MSAPIKVPRGCGFVVTELGRSAAASVETCECRYELRQFLLVCSHCNTTATDLRETRSITWPASRKRD